MANFTYSVSSSATSAAFPISTPSPASSASWVPFTLTQKEINTFHNIDRTLYSRLVINLHRNPVGSMHVMALWIWFERVGRPTHKGNLVNMMLSFSDDIISVLADEAVICLMCVERVDYALENDHMRIPLTQSLTGAPVSLRFFHENRDAIVSSIMKIVNDVCLKVFQDIMHEAIRLQASNPPNNESSFYANVDPSANFQVPNPTQFQFQNPFQAPNPTQFQVPNPSRFQSPNPAQFQVQNPNQFQVPDPAQFQAQNPTQFQVPNPNPHSGFYVRDPRDSPLLPTPKSVPSNYNSPRANQATPFSFFSNPMFEPPAPSGRASSFSNNVPQGCAPPLIKEGGYVDLLMRPSHPYEVEDHKEFLNDEITEVLNRLHIEVSGAGGGDLDGDRHQEVPPDERTIFLTFSKGYPLSESEVREFFTRRYGNCFEVIHMQEVSAPGEQALYARLVLRSASTINSVLNGRSKAKFSINGKHVWARKYVRKITKSPPPPSPSSSPSRSPASLSQMLRASPQYAYGSIQFGSL